MCPGTDVAAADAVAKGATDATAIDAGATAADVGGSLAAADAATTAGIFGGDAALAGGTTATLGDAALAGAGTAAADTAAGTAAAALPEVTVLGTPAAGIGADTALGAAGAGIAAANFIPTTSATPQALDPSTANQLGINSDPTAPPGQDVPDVGGAPTMDPTGPMAGPTAGTPGAGGVDVTADFPEGYPTPDSGPADSNSIMDFLKTPKGMLAAAQLGLGGFSALQAGKIPGAAKTAGGLAGPVAQQAAAVIQSGGRSAPNWTAQKASIDAMIDQEIKNQTAAMQQTLANAGAGDKNSGIVQQQLAEMTSRLETQRQELYNQALQQNITNAVTELTGSDSTLLAIARLQMQGDQEALQIASNAAKLAAQLNQLLGGSQPAIPADQLGG